MTYGVPVWGSYTIFGVVVVATGLLLGMVGDNFYKNSPSSSLIQADHLIQANGFIQVDQQMACMMFLHKSVLVVQRRKISEMCEEI